MRPLVLASASPARLETLRRAGLEPEVIVSGVDETEVVAPTPGRLAAVLAELKCRAVAAGRPDRLVLGCDSVLEFDGEALGKPRDPEVARERWQAMRGNAGVLHTGHCLRRGDDEVVRSVATRVHFAYVTDEEIDAYVASGEPLQVAGGFTIDGLGGAFISRIEGDHHNVTGLSLPVLREMLHDFGVLWTDLWSIRRP
ncbi:Maf family protein [Aeromicrobium sp. PE09-221]|uniref:Maf family protein n=1 Tax=Aeromicrobium sp. PE09-221 TaxID=1898043 RepID=UPI000B3EA685|nr:Maf family protein [Aeromicrobium sp. PE09-221]